MGAIVIIDALSITTTLIVTMIFFIVQLYETAARRMPVNLLLLFMLVLLFCGNLVGLLLAGLGISLVTFFLSPGSTAVPADRQGRQTDNRKTPPGKTLMINLSGDLAMLAAIILIFLNTGQLEFIALAGAMAPGPAGINTVSAPIVTVIGLLLLCGIVIKSGLPPFFTWLDGADKRTLPITALLLTAGPAAAGIYLLCRFHFILSVSAVVNMAITVIGVTTVLAGAAAAIAEADIRRSISYLAAGQIGLLFLAAGCRIYPALVYGYLVYALGVTLLLLSANICTRAVRNQYNVFYLGGLMNHLPGPFWSFLVSGLLIAGIPFSYAAMIFLELWRQQRYLIFVAALGGIFLSAVAVFRLIILVFFTAEKFDRQTRSQLRKPSRLTVGVLFAVTAGLLLVSVSFPFIGFTDFITHSLPAATATPNGLTRFFVGFLPLAASLAGLVAAFLVYQKNTWSASQLAASYPKLHALCSRGFYLDELLSAFVIRPFQAGSELMRKYIDELLLDTIAVNGTGFAVKITGLAANLLQTGHIRHYLLFMLIAIILILLAVR